MSACSRVCCRRSTACVTTWGIGWATRYRPWPASSAGTGTRPADSSRARRGASRGQCPTRGRGADDLPATGGRSSSGPGRREPVGSRSVACGNRSEADRVRERLSADSLRLERSGLDRRRRPALHRFAGPRAVSHPRGSPRANERDPGGAGGGSAPASGPWRGRPHAGIPGGRRPGDARAASVARLSLRGRGDEHRTACRSEEPDRSRRRSRQGHRDGRSRRSRSCSVRTQASPSSTRWRIGRRKLGGRCRRWSRSTRSRRPTSRQCERYGR